MQALAKLIESLKDAGIGGETIQNINVQISDGGIAQGVVGAGTVTVTSMNFGAPTPTKNK